MDRPRLTTDDIAHLAEGNSPENTNGMDCEEAITALAQELLAIRRAPLAAPSDGLREAVVKPLEWEGKPSDCYMQAETILGHYRIYVQYSDEWTCDFEPSSGRPVNVRCWATTPDDCKAAAQADHDARIRAALSASPVQEGGE